MLEWLKNTIPKVDVIAQKGMYMSQKVSVLNLTKMINYVLLCICTVLTVIWFLSSIHFADIHVLCNLTFYSQCFKKKNIT